MLEDDRIRIGACVLAAVVVVLLALRALDGRAAPAGEPVAMNGPPAAQSRPRAKAGLVVHVAGAVRRPGVYRVPAASRADAAVRMAGGFSRRADTAGVNLAAPLQDGQQVVVPRRGAAATGSAAAPGAAAASGGPAVAGGAAPGAPISLSSATAEQLDTLDGIGPTLAQRIVAYRDAHGGFRSVEELRQVEGIGDKRFEALKAAVAP
jgi:competence protein ComEA